MEEKKTKKVILMILCVLASFSLWLYIMNQETPVTVKVRNVQVHILNKDSLENENLALVPNQQFSITLTVKGNAPDIYSVSANKFTVVADLSAYAFKKGECSVPIEIKNYPSNVSIVNDNMWIKIKLDDLAEKPVPVNVNVTGNAAYGYVASTPVVKPTDVLVKGCATYVNTVKSAVATVDLKNAKSDISSTLSLQAYDQNGKVVNEIDSISPGIVSVSIPIRRTKTVGINVNTTGKLNSNLILKSIVPSPDKVDISSESGNTSINSINTEPLDLSSITDSGNVTLKLQAPSGVKLMNSNGTCSVKVTVDKIIQKTFQCTIQTNNLNSSYTSTTDKSTVNVTVSGDENVINNIKQSDITCGIDLTSAVEGDNTVPVTVTIPSGATKVSQDVTNVKATLKKK